MAKNDGVTTPEPMHIDSQRVALTGTALFFIATIALLPFYGWLDDHDHLIWLWTSLAGFLLGVFGSFLVRKHRREGRTD